MRKYLKIKPFGACLRFGKIGLIITCLREWVSYRLSPRTSIYTHRGAIFYHKAKADICLQYLKACGTGYIQNLSKSFRWIRTNMEKYSL